MNVKFTKFSVIADAASLILLAAERRFEYLLSL